MITVFNFIFIRDGTHQHPHGFADTGKDLQRSDTKPPSCLKKTKKVLIKSSKMIKYRLCHRFNSQKYTQECIVA